MNPKDILNLRLTNQQIASQKFKKIEDLVHWMGAIQAQDYPGGLWAIGLRTRRTKKEIEKAISEKKIVRTWPMRGTLHFVAAEDIKWMLELLTPRIRAGAKLRHKQLGLTEEIFSKTRKLIIKALEGGKRLTRPEAYEIMGKSGVDPKEYRGLHMLGQFAQEGLICFGSHQDKNPTFVLIDEWISNLKDFKGEEALAEIAQRYFTSHGPATLYDFVWWTGLKVSDARRGIELSGHKLVKERFDGKDYFLGSNFKTLNFKTLGTYFLPPWDEYLVAYKDRSVAVDLPHFEKVFGKNGLFSPTVLINGKVSGVWRRLTKKDRIVVNINLFSKPNLKQVTGIEEAVENYSKFTGVPVEIKYETVFKK